MSKGIVGVLHEHGTYARYQTCRPSCDACKAANREYNRQYRLDHPRPPKPARPPLEHGYRKYVADRCKCEICRQAGNEYKRNYDKRVREEYRRIKAENKILREALASIAAFTKVVDAE